MKEAVILAGGKGIRFDKNKYSLPKPLIKINNIPLIIRILRLIQDLDFEKVYIVVGYKKNKIIETVRKETLSKIKIEFVENRFIAIKNKSGLSDAILILKDKIKSDNFLVMLGDELYINSDHKGFIKKYLNKDYSAAVGYIIEDNKKNILKNYSLVINNKGLITYMEEKPEVPLNNILGCGTYLFNKKVFNYIEKTKVSKKTGKREIADTLMLMIKDELKIYAYNLKGQYVNINYKQDFEKASKLAKAL